MVASISSINSPSASTKYFAQDGYYMDGSEEQQKSMAWHGKGVEELGLQDQSVTADQFKSIMDGHVPGTQIRLGRTRDGEHQHKPGTDITFSAPKSVSLAGLLEGDNRAIDAHRRAVSSTLDYIEKNILESRAKNKETGEMEHIKGQKMVAATFQHETSRNLDPQLHTHATIANMARGEDGKWRTVENRSLYNNIMLIGAHYHNALAANLKEAGYGIEATGKNGQFEITTPDGKPLYSKEVLDAFSTRSAEIKAAMRDLNYDMGDPEMKQRATLLTRAAKENPDWAKLRAMWQEQAKGLGLEPGQISQNISRDPVSREISSPETALDAVEWATRHLEERNSVFTKGDLIAAALSRSPGSHSAHGIDQAMETLTAQGRLVEAQLGREDGFTTDRALAMEREVISRMEAGKDSTSAVIGTRAVENQLDASNLTDGQKEAASIILTSSDRIVGVQGYAGSGKTTMLSTVREITEDHAKGWFASETNIIGLAPSASAAKTLEGESGIESHTLQSFLTRYSAISEDRAEAGLISKMQDGVKDSVIIVDEASMVSNRQMRDLLRITDTLEVSRVVLIGDIKQLDAVNAGQPFSQLQHAGMQTAVMDQIMRQRDDNLKAAVVEALSGEPAAALGRLDKDIIETDRNDLAHTAATRWLMLPPDIREDTGLMAPTHALREEINSTIRSELTRDGIIHGEAAEISQMVSLRLTEAEREVAANYHEGHTILFGTDISRAGIEAGDALTVTGNRDGLISVKNRDGETVRLDPSGGMAERVEVYETVPMELRAGDVVRWTRNDRELDLVNTHQAEITAIRDGMTHLRGEDGREMHLPQDHPALQHSDYAFNATVHAFQGRTVDRVIAVLDSAHEDLTNQKTFYVEISRARESATLITDDVERLAATLEYNTGERMTALEGIAEEPEAGRSTSARLEAAIEDARVDIGLSLDEFEAITAGAPEPVYDGPDHDLEREHENEYGHEQDYDTDHDRDYGLELELELER